MLGARKGTCGFCIPQCPVRLGHQQYESLGGRASCGQHRLTLTRLRFASRDGIRAGLRRSGASQPNSGAGYLAIRFTGSLRPQLGSQHPAVRGGLSIGNFGSKHGFFPECVDISGQQCLSFCSLSFQCSSLYRGSAKQQCAGCQWPIHGLSGFAIHGAGGLRNEQCFAQQWTNLQFRSSS